MIERSSESARIVLFASNDFLDDQVLNASVTASGTQYLGPLELFTNTLDWALNDDQRVQIRSRAHFNRSLPPMERKAQAFVVNSGNANACTGKQGAEGAKAMVWASRNPSPTKWSRSLSSSRKRG